MKLVVLIGNAAVGKMSVGRELMALTGLRLFHNHMTIEPVIEIFGEYNRMVTTRLREVIFEEFARSGKYGMIFTYMWAFDQPSDWEYIAYVSELFQREGGVVYYVELVASKEERLRRNREESRLAAKASKRDVERSEQRLLADDEKYRCESRKGEIPFPNYLKIDNSDLSPQEAARQIKNAFGL